MEDEEEYEGKKRRPPPFLTTPTLRGQWSIAHHRNRRLSLALQWRHYYSTSASQHPVSFPHYAGSPREKNKNNTIVQSISRWRTQTRADGSIGVDLFVEEKNRLCARARTHARAHAEVIDRRVRSPAVPGFVRPLALSPSSVWSVTQIDARSAAARNCGRPFV